MARVKRGKLHTKKRKKLLKQVKGFKWGRKKLLKLAKEALLHKFKHQYVGRKLKKREKRRLWQVKINAAVRQEELSYSKFIHLLKKKQIELDRKILAHFAEHQPEIFKKIVEEVKS